MTGCDLSIILVSYNTRGMTLACLESIYAQTRDIRFQVLLVDNASTDGSACAVAERFPQVQLIESPHNLGFAAANNLAAHHARGRLLLLLNPDTVVLDRAIERLAAFADRHPQAGIWGGRTLFEDGSLNPSSCWRRPTLWSLFCRGTGLSSAFRGHWLFDREAYGSWRRDTVREVDIVSGCFLLITGALWRRLGGLDPSFFMYAEETDLCLRARKLGFRPMITPAATVIHYGGGSGQPAGERACRQAQTKLQVLRRHWSPAAAALGAAMVWLEAAVRAAGLSVLVALGGSSAPRLRARDAWVYTWRHRREWLARQPASIVSPAGAAGPAATLAGDGVRSILLERP
jgi:GT2 family glycosyltransferase